MKRLCALLCALLMLCSLAACGAENAPPETEDPPPETAEPDGGDVIIIEPTETEPPADTPEPTPPPEPTPVPVMAPIDPLEIPDGLADFLVSFNYGYSDRQGGREYDCENCVDVRANILAQMVTSASCVDYSLYPGEQPVFHWADGTTDPQNMAGEGGNYGEFDPAQVEWIAENILHITEKDYRAVLSRCTVSGAFYLDKNTEGEERFFISVPKANEPNGMVRVLSASSDGTRFELVYDYLIKPNYYQNCYLAVAELREIDGVRYWTLRSQTAKVPDYAPEPAPELFALLTDLFYLNDADGMNHAVLRISEDGSFRGSYEGRELDILSDEFDEIDYYSEFEGHFANPTRINPWTYTVELQDIRYLDEAEEFIITDETGWRVLNVSSRAYGLDGAWVFRIYIPGAPYYRLPQSFAAWYGNTVELANSPVELPTWGFWNPVDGSAFGTVQLQD